ncbi:MAG: hypothetical protein IPF99_24860 [Deltaproteobacteria bacterium]|nr:hypothetical protein [Deltaproteobacteria bacterium]
MRLLRRLRFGLEFLAFRRRAKGHAERFSLEWSDRWPCLDDRTPTTDFDRHYVFHPAWAARVLAKTAPDEHVDISSTLHFCTLVSAFVPVRFFDYRPAPVTLAGLTCGAADLTRLPFADRSIASLSCMHVLEHVGLGRYADPVDYDGDLKAFAELRRVVRREARSGSWFQWAVPAFSSTPTASTRTGRSSRRSPSSPSANSR